MNQRTGLMQGRRRSKDRLHPLIRHVDLGKSRNRSIHRRPLCIELGPKKGRGPIGIVMLPHVSIAFPMCFEMGEREYILNLILSLADKKTIHWDSC